MQCNAGCIAMGCNLRSTGDAMVLVLIVTASQMTEKVTWTSDNMFLLLKPLHSD